MSCVLPGLEETLARPAWLVNRLINEDLPTLDRPMKAYSGRSAGGHRFTDGLLMRYCALCMSINQGQK